MQWCSAWIRSAVAPGLAALILAACSEGDVVAPRIATLRVVSGNDQPGSIGDLLPQPLVVQLLDQAQQPVIGALVTFEVTSGGGVLTPTVDTTDASGFASAHWRLGPDAGLQTVDASLAGSNPVSFAATAAELPSNTAVRFSVESGADQVVVPGSPLPDSIVIRLLDGSGNGVPGQTVEFTLGRPTDGLVTPSTPVTDANGRVAVKWTLGPTAGPQHLIATTGTITTTVVGAGFIHFAAVNAGGQSACGIDDGGVLYCWGSNNDGQIGIGEGPAGSGPVFAFPQSLMPVGDQTFGEVNGGRYHNCAVTKSHVGYCWGDNNNGQLGIGSNSRSANVPTLINLGIAFATISAGRTHSCGLTIGGRPYCWGDNDRGQLGGNVTIDTTKGTVLLNSSGEPKEVGSATPDFFGSFDFSAIAAGGVHTCAIDFFHQAFCWGLGREGQLGDGTNTVSQYIPQLVASPAVFDSITAGFNHSCALTDGGSAFCWGNNLEGQLGSGGTLNANVPISAGIGLTFKQISAGYAHTCALTTGGVAYCWGRNVEGQLGNGTTQSTSTATAVAGGLTFKQISAGDYSTCGVTTGNVAYCWGDNQFGTVGDGTTINRTEPTKVKYQP